MKKKLRVTLSFIVIVFALGFLIPQCLIMPVAGAGKSSYAQNSFWFYPWGKSITHKGVDIFASKGTPIHSSTYGIVVFQGNINMGGNVVYVLGPKWRLHYYAHLDQITTHVGALVSTQSQLGTVGASGNAAGKAPHLHYAIKTMIPYIWKYDKGIQGWKKIIFLNPIDYLNEYFEDNA